jgi:hypothetical protein
MSLDRLGVSLLLVLLAVNSAAAQAPCQSCSSNSLRPGIYVPPPSDPETLHPEVLSPGAIYPHPMFREPERCFFPDCPDCPFNYGYEHTPHDALTPRFGHGMYATLDAVFLARDQINYVPYATLGPGGRVVLSSEDFDIQLEGGGRLLVARPISDVLAVEAAFLGMHEWSDSAAFRENGANPIDGTGNLYSPFTDFGQPAVIGLDYNTLASLTFASSMYTGEVNIRHRVGLICTPELETSFMFGLRYTRVDERFEYLTQSNSTMPGGSAVNIVDVLTKNDLMGVQIGVLGSYRIIERWWFEFDVKAALSQNIAEQQTVYINANNNAERPRFGLFRTSRLEGTTAVVGELSLASVYHITPRLAVRGGYHALFVNGLALATENFQTNEAILTQGPAQIDLHGALIYHGPYAGVTYHW